jgi:hypothetical protein
MSNNDEIISKEEQEEIDWMNIEGHVEVKVKCAKCGKEYEDVVSKVRKEDALKHDTFFCQECSKDAI